ncbi:MAG: CoA transferase subunit A [Firmicutes bacterium]|nr:CoA transferase subunit A [Bacillota bacterium]
MDKVIGLQEAISKVKQGDTLMIGGFGGFGFPSNLVWEVARQNIGELTVIAEDFGNGYSPFEMNSTPLLEKHLVKKAIISYCGGQPRITEQVFKGELEMEMVPQGTLAERIRAGGAGIGGFYTPTGVGTVVAEGKETRVIDGKEYLFELPLKSDVSLVKAWKADRMGNAVFKYTGINFNISMAMAGKLVILEAEEIVEPGELSPEAIQLPGVFVDYVVKTEKVVI